METSFGGTADQARAAGRRLKDDIDDGITNVTAAASGEIKSLIADVEDLIAKIADLNDADVAQVRHCHRQGEHRGQRRYAAPASTARGGNRRRFCP